VGAGIGVSAGFGPVPSISLPASLSPLSAAGGPRCRASFPDIGSVSGRCEDLERFPIPLRARAGTPQQVVQNCRDAITASALPYGVVRVDAASAGPMRPTGAGFAAPIEFKIVYSRRGGLETRQATVSCRLNAAGRVTAAA
jgi:hypothetical protein